MRRADGSVRRLWVVFQLHCEGKVPATWGEVRFGVGASATTPTVVRWPEQDSWQTATRVPVRFEGVTALVSAALAGAHADDFVADESAPRWAPRRRADACAIGVERADSPLVGIKERLTGDQTISRAHALTLGLRRDVVVLLWLCVVAHGFVRG